MVDDMAEEHWKWVEGLLRHALPVQNAKLNMDIREVYLLMEYLYTTAFIHGWKHALEWSTDKQP